MKIKYSLLCLALFLAVFANTACRRPTPHDAFLPDPNCKKMGYDSSNYTAYYQLTYTYSMNTTLNTQAVITSISANFHGSTTAIAMIYDSSLNLIVQSAPTSVSDGWNKIPITATLLMPGSYRLAVAFVVSSGNGIRCELGMGTMYFSTYSYPVASYSLPSGLTANYAMFIYGNYCP